MVISTWARRLGRALRPVVCGVAVAAVLAGAVAAPPTTSDAVRPAGWWVDDTDIRLLPPDRRPVPPPGFGAKRYVALGDSFSSGEGAPQDIVLDEGGPLNIGGEQFKAFYGDPVDDGYECHRSPLAYPIGLASRLGPEWGLDFRACSGAVFDDLDRVQFGEPAQTSAFERGPADLITMTMGGNDLHFGPIVGACVAEALSWSAIGADCRTREAGFVAGLTDLRAQLRGKYADLQRHLAPGGRLVVLGYPRFFPEDPADSCGVGGGLFGLPSAGFLGNIGEANMLWLNDVATRLSGTIQAAASDVGATYVDVTNVLNTRLGTPDDDRHDACVDDEDQRWVNRTIGTNKFEADLAFKWSWHPKAGAHAAMAGLVHACVSDPRENCDSPERREAYPPTPVQPPTPCLSNCPDLTVDDRWTDLRTGPVTSDGPGMTPVLFQALDLPECTVPAGGPGRGTQVERMTTGDLTGDGWKEAVVVLECVPSTSSWPEHVVVLDGAGGPRMSERLDPEITNGQLVATADRPFTTLGNLEPAVDGGVLSVSGDARSDAVSNAGEADYRYRQTFRRDGARWDVGTVEMTRRDDQSDGPTDSGFGDGTYVAYLTSADPVLSTATFDVVQFFDRSSAAAECAADGKVAAGAWCTDYYIRNASDVVRILPVSSVASPSVVGLSSTSVGVDLADLAGRARGSDGPPFRIEVREGEVADIDEIYLP